MTCAQCSTYNPPHARFCSACGKPLGGTVPRDARKLVTALFCDVVHSTALTNTLDAETIKRLLARHFEDTRSVIERHGGEVEKFIGDAVMAVFGAPIAHEDDAVRAVRAAVEMREVAAGLSEELERDLGVTLLTRTGLATGEVIASASPDADTYVTGAAVNLAARLEQSAAEGEILLASETFHLVRDAVSAEALPQLDLKGFDEPMHAYRLLDVRHGAPGHTRHLDSPLVDRVSEQVLLREMLARIRRGRRCQLFTIVGTPGIGKSRLMEEFLSECGTDVTVLHSQCLPVRRSDHLLARRPAGAAGRWVHRRTTNEAMPKPRSLASSPISTTVRWWPSGSARRSAWSRAHPRPRRASGVFGGSSNRSRGAGRSSW